MNPDSKNGGQAFPSFTNQYHYGYQKDLPATVEPGMTLRDHFAGQAMQGMLSNSENDGGYEPTLRAFFRDRTQVRDYAELAYDIADAMLAAREA